MELLERCKLLEKGIVVGKKAERFTAGDDPQLALQILEMMLAGRDVVVEEVEEEVELDDAEEEDADEAEIDRPASARRRSRGRRPLPENLPRVEIEVLPPEVVREGLDAFQRIGQVVSEVVERRPASLVVARIVRPKFVRKDEAPGTVDGDAPEVPAVQIAERLELPIERGLAGPGLLADLMHGRTLAQPQILPEPVVPPMTRRRQIRRGPATQQTTPTSRTPPRGTQSMMQRETSFAEILSRGTIRTSRLRNS